MAALVNSWENMFEQAETRSARREALIREMDGFKVRAYFAERREAVREALERTKVAPPTMSNVAGDKTEIIVEMVAPKGIVEYCASGMQEWIRVPSPARFRLPGPGRYTVLARAIDGPRASDIESEVFWLSPPKVIETADRELTWVEEVRVETSKFRAICGKCGADLAASTTNQALKARAVRRGHYSSKDEQPFALCFDCAMRAEAQKPAPPRQVQIDTGGKRLWLSEPIEFEGNLSVIKPASYAMLAILAGTIRRNPGLCVRLEGHTNSACGFECDGTIECHNNTCAANFRGKGGAIGFSRARAAAVRDWLLTDGGLEPEAKERIISVGLGGSRRLVLDTEAKDNFINRRVEAHIIDFIDPDDPNLS